LQLLSLDLHSERDVHQLCFHAFMMTCFAAHHYASSEAIEKNTVVLRDWCFVKLDRVRKHLKSNTWVEGRGSAALAGLPGGVRGA
jgi:hypothetical protein